MLIDYLAIDLFGPTLTLIPISDRFRRRINQAFEGEDSLSVIPYRRHIGHLYFALLEPEFID